VPRTEGVSIAYFDHVALTRDCIASQLAILLPEFAVKSFASPFEIAPGHSLARPACIILHSHSVGVTDARVAEALMRLREILDGVPIVVLSNLDVTDNVLDAIHSGAVAYILTSLPLRTASEAIRLVAAGCSVVPATAVSAKPAPALDALLAIARDKVHLTPRQFEVLRELWKGKQNKTIAYELSLSEGTVKVHVKHIMRKLHASNRTQVALFLQQTLRGTPYIVACWCELVFSTVYLATNPEVLIHSIAA
jgi:DNA-binding NarL/FixJ family response regulator